MKGIEGRYTNSRGYSKNTFSNPFTYSNSQKSFRKEGHQE